MAYVDVVGLKHLNDTEGHGAGDKLLVRVVALIREHLRSYDLIIRLGGDEFLCVMSNLSSPDARRRFRTIDAVLDAAPETGAIRIGFAEFTPNDSAADLIARADGELIDGVHSIHASRPRRSHGVACSTFDRAQRLWRRSMAGHGLFPRSRLADVVLWTKTRRGSGEERVSSDFTLRLMRASSFKLHHS